MTGFIESLANLFGSTASGSVFVTFLVSMVPIVELRGGLPLGVSLGLNPLLSLAVSVVGNMVPVPFIIFFIQKIFKWLRTKSAWLERLVSRMERKAEKNSDLVEKYSLIGLYILVAIPLPGTGAWTGSLVAALLEIKPRRAFPAIALGVLTAGLIILLVTYGVRAIL